LKATTEVGTDRGEFTAIAAAYSLDRDRERIRPGAFKATIERWQATGRPMPLHWNHGSAAEDVIGSIDPASMRETDAGLLVEGQLDLEDSAVAREVWRLVKRDTVGLSFGYMVESARELDGVRELLALDLFEISLTPAPANRDTRVTSFKSADDPLLCLDLTEDPEIARQHDLVSKAAQAEEKRLEIQRKRARPVHIATFEVQ
jgi:uncharacterized protein